MVKGKGASRLKGNKDKENERECPSTFGKQESKNVPKRTKIIKEKKIRKNGGKECKTKQTGVMKYQKNVKVFKEELYNHNKTTLKNT